MVNILPGHGEIFMSRAHAGDPRNTTLSAIYY